MKKNIQLLFIILMGVLLCHACKNESPCSKQKDNAVFFDLDNSTQDSLVFMVADTIPFCNQFKDTISIIFSSPIKYYFERNRYLDSGYCPHYVGLNYQSVIYSLTENTKLIDTIFIEIFNNGGIDILEIKNSKIEIGSLPYYSLNLYHTSSILIGNKLAYGTWLNFNDSEPKVLFNKTQGLIAFSDSHGNYWTRAEP
jgi:hypothetical protein